MNELEKILNSRRNKPVIVSIFYEQKSEDINGVLRDFNSDFIKLECNDEKLVRVINRNACVLLMVSWKEEG